MKTGIYCIENLITGKRYIGKASNISSRWNEHKRKLRLKIHDNQYLQNSWDKYGEDNFKFLIIELCKKEDLVKQEIFWIKEDNTKTPFGYNMTDGGDGTPGLVHSNTTKEKMSKSQKGRVQSKEQILKRKQTILNWTDEEKEIARANRSSGHKGQKVSDKQKAYLSSLYKGKPSLRKNYFPSDETKRKVSESMKEHFRLKNKLLEEKSFVQ